MIWANVGYSLEAISTEPYISLVSDINPNDSESSAGNIVGIQPYMLPSDYLSEELFFEKMDNYFTEAAKAGFLGDKTIVLLPEYIGTWLVIANEKVAVSKASTLTGAMATLLLSNPISYFKNYRLSISDEDRIASTLFRMKSKEMARIYSATFQKLSKTYGIHIVAGSINLPGAEVIDGKLTVNPEKPIHNTSFIFIPTGEILPYAVEKAFPIDSEKPFVTAANPTNIPTITLPIGKIGVLVCADSWYPESYQAIQQADIILVNSYCAGNGAMTILWSGYNGAPAPSDVDPSDIGTITEQEAWKKYALPGRISSTQARHGANIFLRGQLWDLGTDGQPFFIHHGKLIETIYADQGGIWNLSLADTGD
ncbi:carbon-nitrogen hydrolase [Mongoliitalea lutea]|uniref:Carbon-nitrogen hydrolase n=2 Tax=Mongoliitalea lutea TaxID=849756 RepID=A0A8J3D331_9BACT|nr:carbon-nitrogen hydrolase [Mongoliitalea lutea]